MPVVRLFAAPFQIDRRGVGLWTLAHSCSLRVQGRPARSGMWFLLPRDKVIKRSVSANPPGQKKDVLAKTLSRQHEMMDMCIGAAGSLAMAVSP